jgi:hypothetical protein
MAQDTSTPRPGSGSTACVTHHASTEGNHRAISNVARSPATLSGIVRIPELRPRSGQTPHNVRPLGG